MKVFIINFSLILRLVHFWGKTIKDSRIILGYDTCIRPYVVKVVMKINQTWRKSLNHRFLSSITEKKYRTTRSYFLNCENAESKSISFKPKYYIHMQIRRSHFHVHKKLPILQLSFQVYCHCND